VPHQQHLPLAILHDAAHAKNCRCYQRLSNNRQINEKRLAAFQGTKASGGKEYKVRKF
jgi:hypothetical protein